MKGTNVIADKDSVESSTNERRAAYGRPTGAYERGRGFDEDVEQAEANTCPECGGRVTMNVHETVCDDCGLVIEDEKVDHGPEWYSSDEGAEERCRVGAPNTVARHDRGMGTDIGLGTDGTGRAIDGRKRAQLRRLRREHRRAKFDSKAERNRMCGFIEIRRLAGALGLETSLRDQACQLFRTAQNEGLLLGRSIEAIAGGCVYAVCRLAGHPRPIEEVASVSKVERGRIENGYGVLNRSLGLPTPPVKPEQYLPTVASKVGVDARTERRARELLDATDATTHQGVHPGGVVAGALYQAGRETGAAVTQRELANAADVTPITVRERYREFA